MLLNTGRNIDAIEAFKVAIRMDDSFLPAWGNIGNALNNEGRYHEAMLATHKVLELDPNNPTAHMNLGGIYKDLGNLDKALASTLKSLELNPDNPDAHMNLAGIYKDLGNAGQALASNLKSLELNPANHVAVKNLKGIIEQLNFYRPSAKILTYAYELLLNQTDIAHRELSQIFLQVFLPTIQKASESDPILSKGNEAVEKLASDWRFRKSLTLMIPPSSEAEAFFIRLRKELLNLAIQEGTVPEQLKCLTESLAAQCFLNEYVYASSPEEDDHITNLIKSAAHNQEETNRYLAIIGCYKAIYTTDIRPEFINNYPTPDDSSKELITAQFKEPRQEQKIKSTLQGEQNIDNTTSQLVQEMYERSPYPRFKFCDYTDRKTAISICESIKIESTRKNLYFSDELTSTQAAPKVLIAGCGTGKQVITASRYKNAVITAIDLSSSSLAYAIRKTKEYKDECNIQKMDLLNIAGLGDIFDIVECSSPSPYGEAVNGLSALIQQLKPEGYIKIGLYSENARKVIVEARKAIQRLEIESTPDGIRRFRKQVLNREIKELLDLPKLGRDFYSLSECRDLCFHVQEHRFTTESLQKLLNSNSLTFCGFMVPEPIKKLYREKYPGDNDMTSLPNWGEFEEEYPLTFASMYQFWAQKSLKS